MEPGILVSANKTTFLEDLTKIFSGCQCSECSHISRSISIAPDICVCSFLTGKSTIEYGFLQLRVHEPHQCKLCSRVMETISCHTHLHAIWAVSEDSSPSKSHLDSAQRLLQPFVGDISMGSSTTEQHLQDLIRVIGRGRPRIYDSSERSVPFRFIFLSIHFLQRRRTGTILLKMIFGGSKDESIFTVVDSMLRYHRNAW